MATASRQYSKEEGSNVVEGTPKYGRGLRVGKAVIPWCEMLGCWILPDGPAQKNRMVNSAHKVLKFARHMHCEMTGMKI